MLLADVEIKEAIGKKEIEIDPFEEKYLQGASYDMRVGNKAVVSARVSNVEEIEKKKPEIKNIENSEITIPPGGIGLFITLERIRLNGRHVANVGPITNHMQRGIVLLYGIQIDPGFDAHLLLGLANLSLKPFTIRYSDPICSIQIVRLSKNVAKVFSPPERKKEMDLLREGEIPQHCVEYINVISAGTLLDSVSELRGNVKSLNINFYRIWFPIMIGMFVIIGAIIARLFFG
jgi:deoxycytidine triphosphate deaminase